MKKDIAMDLAWGGGMLVLALAATTARKLGYVDGDMVNRIVMGAIGLMVAWFGNRMPKTIAPTACARQAQRVGGWAMMLSGLVYAGLWAFASTEVALIGGSAAVILGIAVTFFYCLSLRNRVKAA